MSIEVDDDDPVVFEEEPASLTHGLTETGGKSGRGVELFEGGVHDVAHFEFGIAPAPEFEAHCKGFAPGNLEGVGDFGDFQLPDGGVFELDPGTCHDASFVKEAHARSAG